MSTESWVIATAQTVDIPDVHDLVVTLTDGSVDIVGQADRTGITLEVIEISDRPLEVVALDGQVRLGYDFAGFEGVVDRVRVLRDKERVVARLLVPAESTVKASTAQAGVNVVGVRARVSVNSATGPVRVEGTTGKVSVRTASAPITVSEHVGDLRLNTAAGQVTAAGQLARVNTVSVAGRVELTSTATTPHISVASVSGDVAIRLAAATPVNLRVKSVSGKVSLDGAPLASGMSHGTVVDHCDAPGEASAYISVNTVTADLAVSRS